jgi:hypothetical protein
MKKKTMLVFITTALSLTIITGCGGSSSSNSGKMRLPMGEKKFGEKKFFPSNIDTLAKSMTNYGTYGSMIKTLTPSGDAMDNVKNDEYIKGCMNGGNVKVTNLFDNPFAFLNMKNLHLKPKVIFDNCVQDGVVSNGKLDTNLKRNGDKYNLAIKYANDFTTQGNNRDIKIFKDSTIDIDETDNGYNITQNTNALYSNQGYRDKDLKLFTKPIGDKYMIYPISGEEILGDETYKVDSSYDASKTPMILDNQGNIEEGGIFKYINSKNEHIILEAVEKNKIKISTDTDGDGKIEDSKIVNI